MKKLLLILSLFVLVGCSNDKKENKEINNSTEIEVKLDKKVIEEANAAVENFNKNGLKAVKLSFDDKKNEFNVNYIEDEHKEVVQDIADNLKSDFKFKFLEFLSTSIRDKTKEVIASSPESVVVLKNPNDSENDLFVIDSETVKYPATNKANNGGVPEVIENVDKAIETANFMYKPNGKTYFDYDNEKLVVDLTINDNDESEGAENKFYNTIKSSAKQLKETLKDVYKFEYPIIVNNNGKKVIEVSN